MIANIVFIGFFGIAKILDKEKAPKGDFPIHYLCWLSQPRHRPVTVRIMSLCMHMLAHKIPLAQLARIHCNIHGNKAYRTPERGWFRFWDNVKNAVIHYVKTALSYGVLKSLTIVLTVTIHSFEKVRVILWQSFLRSGLELPRFTWYEGYPLSGNHRLLPGGDVPCLELSRQMPALGARHNYGTTLPQLVYVV